MSDITRRSALRIAACGLACAGAGALTWLGLRAERDVLAKPRELPKLAPADTARGLAIGHGADPKALTRAVIAALGGMGAFVAKGDRVLVKPNIAWNRTPEQGANTHPDVVEALVQLCLEAGASKVVVTDVPCNAADATFERSGIEAAARRVGATVIRHASTSETLVGGHAVSRWPLIDALYETDKLINVPVVKHHGSSTLTAGMKNLFGVAGGDRGLLHGDLDASIVDLAAAVRPTLTVLDATRVLMRSGPTGGRLSDVRRMDAMAAGVDPVALDAWAAEQIDRKAEDIAHLRLARDRKLGVMDWRSLSPREVRL
ncbi:MAG: hypothetical protein AMXMBFR64_21580 [Myxococcales bacterium]